MKEKWERWTADETVFLRKNCEMPDDVIAEALGMSVESVRQRRKYLGISPGLWRGVCKPEARSKTEKEMRILNLASEMRVKLLG